MRSSSLVVFGSRTALWTTLQMRSDGVGTVRTGHCFGSGVHACLHWRDHLAGRRLLPKCANAANHDAGRGFGHGSAAQNELPPSLRLIRLRCLAAYAPTTRGRQEPPRNDGDNVVDD